MSVNAEQKLMGVNVARNDFKNFASHWNAVVAILFLNIITNTMQIAPQRSLLSPFMKGVKCLIAINAIAILV